MITFRESPQNRTEQAALNRKTDRLLRPSQADLEPMQEAIREGFEQNFETQSAGGAPWAALSPATIAQRLLLGYGTGPMLHRSGDYHDTFTQAGNADHVSEIAHNSGITTLSEGSRHPLTGFLESGTSKMPARQVLVLSNGARKEAGRAFYEMVDGILNA